MYSGKLRDPILQSARQMLLSATTVSKGPHDSMVTCGQTLEYHPGSRSHYIPVHLNESSVMCQANPANLDLVPLRINSRRNRFHLRCPQKSIEFETPSSPRKSCARHQAAHLFGANREIRRDRRTSESDTRLQVVNPDAKCGPASDEFQVVDIESPFLR